MHPISDKSRIVAYIAISAFVLVVEIVWFGVPNFSWFWFLVCFVAAMMGVTIGHAIKRFNSSK